MVKKSFILKYASKIMFYDVNIACYHYCQLFFLLGPAGLSPHERGEYVAHFNFSLQIPPIHWGDTAAVSTFVRIFLEIIEDEIGRILPNPVNAGNGMGARNASYIEISASTVSSIQVHHKSFSR